MSTPNPNDLDYPRVDPDAPVVEPQRRANSMLSTLMHEPFHIYFGRQVTEHRDTAGKFGGINCIVQFAFNASRRTPPARVTQRCTDMAVRQEFEFT